jgi:hypothetical protein
MASPRTSTGRSSTRRIGSLVCGSGRHSRATLRPHSAWKARTRQLGAAIDVCHVPSAALRATVPGPSGASVSSIVASATASPFASTTCTRSGQAPVAGVAGVCGAADSTHTNSDDMRPTLSIIAVL